MYSVCSACTVNCVYELKWAWCRSYTVLNLFRWPPFRGPSWYKSAFIGCVQYPKWIVQKFVIYSRHYASIKRNDYEQWLRSFSHLLGGRIVGHCVLGAFACAARPFQCFAMTNSSAKILRKFVVAPNIECNLSVHEGYNEPNSYPYQFDRVIFCRLKSQFPRHSIAYSVDIIHYLFDLSFRRRKKTNRQSNNTVTNKNDHCLSNL